MMALQCFVLIRQSDSSGPYRQVDFSPSWSTVHGGTNKKSCTDSDGKVYPHGTEYYPDLDSDACKSCTCENGSPSLCMTAGCHRVVSTDCMNPKYIPRTCCQFKC